jgi:hypothetical protein
MMLVLLVNAASVVGIVLSFALVMRYLGSLTVWNEISPWATDTLDVITRVIAATRLTYVSRTSISQQQCARTGHSVIRLTATLGSCPNDNSFYVKSDNKSRSEQTPPADPNGEPFTRLYLNDPSQRCVTVGGSPMLHI